MKLFALLLMAIIIPSTLGAQDARVQLEGAHRKPPAPGKHWNVVPVFKYGQPTTWAWSEVIIPPVEPPVPPDPPAPPQPPAPPKPVPVPVPPVVPTPQCEVPPTCQVVYYPVYYIEPSRGAYQARRSASPPGCGFFRRIFGRCR
jgi:hypothetical protein